MNLETITNKICSADEAAEKVRSWQEEGQSVVFTNGCFDILHKGHVTYLAKAAELGHKLVLGLNSDNSVKRLKGEGRPIQDEASRALIMASLEAVDLVVLFAEDTPLALISQLLPDVLVKGGDYDLSTIVGADEVMENGGRVTTIPVVEGYSTTSIEERLKS